MQKLLYLVFFIFISSQIAASTEDLNSLCQGKEQEVFKFNCSEKGNFPWYADINRQSHATLLNKEGFILVFVSGIEGSENFSVDWKDIDGSKYRLETNLVSIHPKDKQIAIFKVDHPFGGEFAQPKLSFNRIKVNQWILALHIVPETYFQLSKVAEIKKDPGKGIEGFWAPIGLIYKTGQNGAPVYNTLGETIGVVAGSTSENYIWFQPLFSIEPWIKEVISL